jgi:membrane protein
VSAVTTSRFDVRALREPGELKTYGKELGEEIKRDDVASLAAAVSFKIVLAIFPALLAAVAISALVINEQDLTELFANFPSELTEVVQPQLEEFIDRAASGSIAIGGVLAGLWAATSAAFTLNKALSRAYDETEERKVVAARIAALAVTVALLLALIAISVLLVAGGTIEDRLLGTLPLTDTARDSLALASTAGRYVAAVLLLMVLFAFIYWVGPDFDDRPTWRWITPGAVVAVLTWLVASGLFGWYVANFGRYTDTDSPYGPLGSAIVFMLWLQLSMFALLLGAEINQVLVVRARRRRSAGAARDAGSVGRDENGRTTSDATANSEPPRTAGANLRAATTPVPSRGTPAPDRGGQRRASPADPSLDRTREIRIPSAARSAAVTQRWARTAADTGPFRRQDGDAPAAGADEGGSADAHGTRRPVPTATAVGAGVAAISGVVGLAGLLRRLRG